MKKFCLLLILTLTIQVAFSQKVARVKHKGKFGYIKTNGEWLIQPTYKYAGDFSNGLAAVKNQKKWGYINAKGEVVIPFRYNRAKKFDSGIAIVQQNKKWFYINKTGEEIKMPPSEKLFDFNNGVAFIRKNKKTGLINHKGEVLISPTYNKILKFRNGFAKVKNGKFWGMIDTKGKVIIDTTTYSHIGGNSNGIIPAKKGNSYGLIVNNTNFIEVPNAIKIWNFEKDQDLTYARDKNRLVGFINRKGEWVIKPQYKKVKAFSNGLAPVSIKGKKWGYINKEGALAIPETYKDAEVFNNGLAPVKIANFWGFINQTGELVIKNKYKILANTFVFKDKNTKGFIDKIARVGHKKKWGYIDTKGNLLNNTWYQNAELFVNLN